jgi:HEPN domain-containing protein
MPVNVEKHINYWQNGAEECVETARLLLEGKRAKEAIFFAHLALEKMIKALVVKVTKDIPPYSHDLLALAKKAKLDLSSEHKEFLAEMTRLAVQGRYPDLDRPSPTVKKAKDDLRQTEEIIRWLTPKLSN